MSPTPIPTPSTTASSNSAAPAWVNPQRKALFEAWFTSLQWRFALRPDTLRLATQDASFRRYLRVDGANSLGSSTPCSYIIMDAPPENENCQPFVRVAKLMQQADLAAPEVLAWDEANGFMLLTDLGSHTLMQVIQQSAPTAALPLDLYLGAVDALIQWQLASRPGVLPEFDAAMQRREMELYPQWYIAQHRHYSMNEADAKILSDAFDKIIAHNQVWPKVYVHSDFMPRNLMVLPDANSKPSVQRIGLLDFQDAVYGPITYDIASLMRDAFLSWEEDVCLDVTIRYWQKARKAGLPVGDDFGVFYHAVEWMGLQRHLRIAGIFARLTLRDGKPHYLADAPRFIGYIRATCARYMELKPLLRLVERIEGIPVPNAYAFGRV